MKQEKEILKLIKSLPEDRQKLYIDIYLLKLADKVTEKVNDKGQPVVDQLKEVFNLGQDVKEEKLIELMDTKIDQIAQILANQKLELPSTMRVTVDNPVEFPKEMIIANPPADPLRSLDSVKNIESIDVLPWLVSEIQSIKKAVDSVPSQLRKEAVPVRVTNSSLKTSSNVVSGGGQAMIPFQDQYSNSVKPMVNEFGRLQVDSADASYTLRVDEFAGSSLLYRGYALIGSTTSAAVWRIAQTTQVGTTSGNIISTLYADGNGNFDNVWDNRTILNYK